MKDPFSTISQILDTKVPDVLYHYTSAAGLIGILESGKIWTTKIQYLNDNSELQLAYEHIRKMLRLQQREHVKTRTEQENKKILPDKVPTNKTQPQQRTLLYTRTEEEIDKMLVALDDSATTNVSVASFSEVGDQLSQWRGYCEIGKGYSIGFSGPKLRQVLKEKGYALARCVYDTRTHIQMVMELINDYPLRTKIEKAGMPLPTSTFGIDFSIECLFLAPLIKSESFQEEKEWRLITPPLNYPDAKYRPGNHSLIPYWDVDIDIANTLKSIIIGPTPEPGLSASAVRGLLIQKGFSVYDERIDISPSKIPFRKV